MTIGTMSLAATKQFSKRGKRILGGLFIVAMAGPFCGAARSSDPGVDFSKAIVIAPSKLSGPPEKAVRMLVEEVEKRTRIRLQISNRWPADNVPVIAVGMDANLADFAGAWAERIAREVKVEGAEGYRVGVLAGARTAPTCYVVGADARGMLFGVGRLLRELQMQPGKLSLHSECRIATAPKYPLRGHQLGYRPKTNSYDGWNLAQWEQYIRDLAVFGCNAVELIPPRSDDDADSPHFPLPPMAMMIGMSKLLDDYGLDVWIWYPAMDRDYENPATVEFALKEWNEVFRQLPRIDVVMVPGGDPGHTQPKYLMPMLARQTQNLRKHHPKAQMWLSPQGFTKPWFDEFLKILHDDKPTWLGGIVHGPQIRLSIPELRKAIPPQYPIRRYPDITHSIRCEYPVPDWDTAYALTEAREVINPRPVDQRLIFKAYENEAIGFITYSEGCNDDVNKFVWSGLGWDSQADVAELLRQYGRYFIGEDLGRDFAAGLFALERNWRGPLLANESVFTTLAQFQTLERRASPEQLANWRFQQALYRAYYDAYNRARLIYETALENSAMEKLRSARTLGAVAATVEAEAILRLAIDRPVAVDWRGRVFELAEALFQSIRMQLSVQRYKAIDVGRGANLDTIDVPLNDRLWLTRRFEEIRKLDGETLRLKAIDEIVRWTDPGPGGFYDDLGNAARQPHLVKEPAYEIDPATYRAPRVGFLAAPGRRLSWSNHAEALFDSSVRVRYNDLDPKAAYRVRVVYAANDTTSKIRLVANDGIEIHPFIAKQPKPLEFDVPSAATHSGRLELIWTAEPGRGGSGRGCQISEIWLIKR